MLGNPRLEKKYKIEKLLGNGSFSVVYRAKERRCDRNVALKALQRDVYDASSHEYAESEVSAMGRLWDHRNIVSVHTVEPGDDEFLAFIVMEYVDGGSLRRRMQSGALPLQDALAIAYDICCGLEYAHERFVVHRDVKPRNVLITNAGIAKVSDFGVAQVRKEPHDFASTFAGTRRYMAPEQYEETYDERVDVFAAGVLLWEMAMGEFPYAGRTHDEIRESKETNPVPPPDLPEPVRAILSRALCADPFDRFKTMSDMREAVEASLTAIYRRLAEERFASGDPAEVIESRLAPMRSALRIPSAAARCIDELAMRHVEDMTTQSELAESERRVEELAKSLIEDVCRRRIDDANGRLGELATTNIAPSVLELIEALWRQVMGPSYIGRTSPRVVPGSSTPRPGKLDPGPEYLYVEADDESTALALREMGQEYERENKWRRARSNYRKSAKLYSDRAAAARKESAFARAARLYERSGESYRDARDDRKRRAYFALAGDCWAEHAAPHENANTRDYCAKAYRAAAQAYDQAEDAISADRRYQSAATQLYLAARDAQRAGDLRSAETRCRQAIDLASRTSRWELTDVARQLLYQIRADKVQPEDDEATDLAV